MCFDEYVSDLEQWVLFKRVIIIYISSLLVKSVHMYFHVFTMIHESIWSGRKLSCLYKHVDDCDYDYDYVDKISQFENSICASNESNT